VARALASTFFYRAESIPLLIFANQRPAYLDSLMAADRSDFGPMISFFLDRGIDTTQLVSESLMTEATPAPSALVSRIKNPITNAEGLSSREISDIQLRLAQEIARSFDERIDVLKIPDLSVVMRPGSSKNPPKGYETEGLCYRLDLQLNRKVPKVAPAKLTFSFWLKKTNRLPFLIQSDEGSDHLEIRLDDLYPEFTQQFLLRLDQWVQRHLARMLADLARQTDVDAS
jgi:hypothetical protein